MFNKKHFQQKLLYWFSHNKRDLPWRKNRTPYRVWVSEIMLQQTQVVTVVPYFKKWFQEFPSIQALAKAPVNKVIRAWEGLGYYSRARNLKKGAEYIARELKGKFPFKREELLKVPGIGPYTAGAISSIAFSKREPLVDGNVGRVFARVFEISGIWNEPKTNKLLWEKAGKLLPAKRVGDFNEALMELGAMICLKDHPACLVCPVSKFCRAYQRLTINKYPAKKKSQVTKVEKITLIFKRKNKFLVRKKKIGKIMGGLYEFPTIAEPRMMKEILKGEQLDIRNIKNIGKVSHGYTRYKATLNLWEGKLVKGSLADRDFEKPRWVTRRELKQLPFPAVYRKIIIKVIGVGGGR